jgi:group I intron endonuclease
MSPNVLNAQFPRACQRISNVVAFMPSGMMLVAEFMLVAQNIFGYGSTSICALLAKHHQSRHLQRAWNKYGQEAFTVILLEKVGATKMLDEREQFWMDHFRAYTKNFNSAPKAESTRDYKWTESQKKKIRGYRRGVWTPDSHKRVSEALKQRHAKNPEWRKNAQMWLHSPENEAKRIAAVTAAYKRPEIYNPLVQHLDKVRKMPARIAELRKIYFDKFDRKSFGFNSPEEMDQVCLKLHSEGKTCREIGRLFNIDHHGISSRLQRLGAILDRVRKAGFSDPEEMVQACSKLYLEGKSCREIGRIFNIDRGVISRRLRRAGVILKRNR